MADIKITLETLYDILRNEKKREELQTLEDTFFIDVVSYLREKKVLLNSKKDSNTMFATGEREKLEYELRSIKRILKEIFDKREKKIIDIAVNRSRTGSDIIDSGAMLREERIFYEKLLHTLDEQRKGVLFHLFKGELPNISNISRFNVSPESRLILPPIEHDEQHTISNDEETEPNELIEKKLMHIKFTHAVPSFIWRDMKVYGPFDIGDETRIFPEVAALLIRKGRAEEA